MNEGLSKTMRYAVHRLAYWYLQRGRPAQAETLARGLIALDSRDGMGWLYYGEARFGQGDLEGAARGLEQAARFLEDRGDIWMRYGEVLSRLKRAGEARKALERGRKVCEKPGRGQNERVKRRINALIVDLGRF